MLIRFILGGLIYMGIETCYDGTSHYSMGIIGGLIFIIGGSYDECFDIPYWLLIIAVGITVTLFEYIGGKIFNKNHDIWDYSQLPLNIDGQICLYFTVFWTLVMAPIIVYLDNSLRLIWP